MGLSFGKEWKELKKFESLSDFERSIVFYAENKASLNHLKPLIIELTEKFNLPICYVTSVKDDSFKNNGHPLIKSFFIFNKRLSNKTNASFLNSDKGSF